LKNFYPLMICWWPLGFQNMIRKSGARLDCLHDYALAIILCVVILVGVLLIGLSLSFSIRKFYLEDSVLEFLWTCYPVGILSVFGVFSLFALYEHEGFSSSLFTIKVVGHQWYWSYDYSNFEGVSFDRYILPLGDLFLGGLRNLEVDSRVVVPFGVTTQFLITRADVLHSWAVPSLRLKVDANPGKLNCVNSLIFFPGLFYGQCREICGVNHSFIPICLEVTSPFLFSLWILKENLKTGVS